MNMMAIFRGDGSMELQLITENEKEQILLGACFPDSDTLRINAQCQYKGHKSDRRATKVSLFTKDER